MMSNCEQELIQLKNYQQVLQARLQKLAEELQHKQKDVDTKMCVTTRKDAPNALYVCWKIINDFHHTHLVCQHVEDIVNDYSQTTNARLT